MDTGNGNYTKRSQYFLVYLVSLQNNLNIIGLLVVKGCTYCEVFKILESYCILVESQKTFEILKRNSVKACMICSF